MAQTLLEILTRTWPDVLVLFPAPRLQAHNSAPQRHRAGDPQVATPGQRGHEGWGERCHHLAVGCGCCGPSWLSTDPGPTRALEPTPQQGTDSVFSLDLFELPQPLMTVRHSPGSSPLCRFFHTCRQRCTKLCQKTTNKQKRGWQVKVCTSEVQGVRIFSVI